VNIEIEDSVYENVVTIGLTIILNGITDEKSQYEFKVKYVGVFEIGSEVELPVEKFIQANGPAILFPFLREHIASMSLKANISPILLPPINFLKFQKNE
ncbi:protein-export chaperone SecB, partial [uncultured Flavobacterium sp.]|uniref:protein-export chaperone SecB n=1 Tax=uncultured Flavobacterium sp. TaxID=165435 RepID=UPI0025CE31EE